MARTITEGLFPSVAGLFATPGAEQAQRLQMAGQPVNPLSAVSGDMGFLGQRMQQGIGRAFGQMPEVDRKRQVFQQIVRTLGQQGVDVSTPEGMVKLAQQIGNIPGFEGEALGLRQQAVQMAQQAQTQGLETQFKESQIAKNLADAQKSVRPETIKTPAAFSAVGQELGIPAKPNIADYTQAEAAAINARIQENKQREAAAGVPGSGEVKVTDLNTATGIVDRFTKDSKDRLSTVGRLRTLLSEAQGGSGTAVAQMRRELVKLVGDSQIGQGEVRDALGSLGIVGDVVSGINQLFTGTPSKEKLADVQRVINALESNVAKSYNSGIERSRKVLTEGRLGQQTVESLLPPVYTPASAKKKSKFVEGKIYKDAQDNRARYVIGPDGKGKFEPIQ